MQILIRWNTAVTYAPALYKIFDEIIVNSADHKQRDGTVKNLKVGIRRKMAQSLFTMMIGYLLSKAEIDEKTKRSCGYRNDFGVLLVL